MKGPLCLLLAATLLCGCGHLNPLYENTTANRQKSILPPKDGRALAFIEFGEQGSYQDPSQLQNAVDLIKRTPRPLVITYVHGWHNNAGSADVERFSSWLSELSTTELIRNAGLPDRRLPRLARRDHGYPVLRQLVSTAGSRRGAPGE